MQIRNSHFCHISYCAQIEWGKLLMLREKQTSNLLRNSGRNKRLRYNGLRISAEDSLWFVCVDLNVLLAEKSCCLCVYSRIGFNLLFVVYLLIFCIIIRMFAYAYCTIVIPLLPTQVNILFRYVFILFYFIFLQFKLSYTSVLLNY